MTKTRDELAIRALEELGFSGANITEPVTPTKTRAQLVSRGLEEMGFAGAFNTLSGNTVTREDLTARALQELAIPGAGQVANAEDTAIADAEVEPLIADLAKRAVYIVDDPDAIAEEALVPLAVVLAQSIATSFGAAMDPQKRAAAEAQLRAIEPDTGPVDREVDALVADLAARGVYTVASIAAIVPAAFTHLAVLLANNAGRTFGKPWDEKKAAMAEAMLKQVAPDVARINREIPPIIADLESRQVYSGAADEDEIDDDAFVHLARIVANSCARMGLPPSEPDPNKAQFLERQLRNLRPYALSGQPIDVDYF